MPSLQQTEIWPATFSDLSKQARSKHLLAASLELQRFRVLTHLAAHRRDRARSSWTGLWGSFEWSVTAWIPLGVLSSRLRLGDCGWSEPDAWGHVRLWVKDASTEPLSMASGILLLGSSTSRCPKIICTSPTLSAAAVEELKFSYYNKETLFFSIHPYYGNMNPNSYTRNTNP